VAPSWGNHEGSTLAHPHIHLKPNLTRAEACLLGSHWRDRVQFFNRPWWCEATRGRHVLSFVPAEHILDGIHDGRVAVAMAILVDLLLILLDCVGVDDRVVAFAVVVSAKPHHDVLRERDFIKEILLAGYFSNVQRLLCLRRDLCEQEQSAG